MRCARLLCALIALTLLGGCRGEGGSPGAGAEGGAGPSGPDLHPFFREAQGYLQEGDWASAEVVFENNRLVDEPDRLTLLAGAGAAFLAGRPNIAGIDLAKAHELAPPDCMTLVFLGTARRRVDVATGSRAAWRGVLERADCPPPAYAVAAERYARNDSAAADPAAKIASGPGA